MRSSKYINKLFKELFFSMQSFTILYLTSVCLSIMAHRYIFISQKHPSTDKMMNCLLSDIFNFLKYSIAFLVTGCLGVCVNLLCCTELSTYFHSCLAIVHALTQNKSIQYQCQNGINPSTCQSRFQSESIKVL